MQRNRELIGPYQGIKSAYQGNFLPDAVAAMTTIRIADGAAFSLCHAQRARLRQDRNPTKKSVQSRQIRVSGNGTAHPVTRLENLALGSRLPPTRLDRKTCSAARSSLSSFGVWRRGTRRMRTLLRLQHKELVGTRCGVPDFALAARELPHAGIRVGQWE